MNIEYLIKMLDGGLKNVETNSWCEREGCETCDYGSKYITEIVLSLEDVNLEIELGAMYESPYYSEGDLMKLLCGNIDEISKMTQEKFIQYVKESIIKVCEEKGYEYKPEFKKVVSI